MAVTADRAQSNSVLRERRPVPSNAPELARLGESFNRLLARVECIHESQQRFIADASHELRTPPARRPRSQINCLVAVQP